jgi:HD superfamily phosphodiesterase
VYYFGSLAGKKRGLKFDPELLYLGAMFHDMGSVRGSRNTAAKIASSVT